MTLSFVGISFSMVCLHSWWWCFASDVICIVFFHTFVVVFACSWCLMAFASVLSLACVFLFSRFVFVACLLLLAIQLMVPHVMSSMGTGYIRWHSAWFTFEHFRAGWVLCPGGLLQCSFRSGWWLYGDLSFFCFALLAHFHSY